MNEQQTDLPLNVCPTESGESKDKLPLVLNAQEVAQILRVERKTVYNMHRQGQLPGGKRLGRDLVALQAP